MYIHYICQWDWGKRRKRIWRQGPTAERMRTLAGRERMPSVSIWRRRVGSCRKGNGWLYIKGKVYPAYFQGPRCLELERAIASRVRSGSLGLDDAVKLSPGPPRFAPSTSSSPPSLAPREGAPRPPHSSSPSSTGWPVPPRTRWLPMGSPTASSSVASAAWDA